MLPEMSRQILGRLSEGSMVDKVTITAVDGKMAYEWTAPELAVA